MYLVESIAQNFEADVLPENKGPPNVTLYFSLPIQLTLKERSFEEVASIESLFLAADHANRTKRTAKLNTLT